MKGTNDIKAIPLPGFEVYDDARTVNDEAGTVVVLLGHTSGQPPHKPLVQTLAILPDSFMDDSATMVPALSGEGTAKFSKDTSDINVELSMPSVAQNEKIAMDPPLSQDKTIKAKLQWKNDKYVPAMDFPQDLHAGMMILARSLKHPEFAGPVVAALGPEGGKLFKETAPTDFQTMKVKKEEDKHKSSFYTIESPAKKIELELKKPSTGGSWGARLLQGHISGSTSG